MELTKTEIVDRIEVVENGCVQVRTMTSIMEDGKQISCNFHRHVIAPGNDYSGQILLYQVPNGGGAGATTVPLDTSVSGLTLNGTYEV